MISFWIWIVVIFVGIVGVSVLVGRALSRPRGASLDRHERMMALKASGALRHRKSNRD